ncbi:hypothetical protein GCM10009678_28570 [Actinomadura kijaniata]
MPVPGGAASIGAASIGAASIGARPSTGSGHGSRRAAGVAAGSGAVGRAAGRAKVTVTRRFLARPASVPLEATGASEPWPRARNVTPPRVTSPPSAPRTASARRRDSGSLTASFPVPSVCPSIRTVPPGDASIFLATAARVCRAVALRSARSVANSTSEARRMLSSPPPSSSAAGPACRRPLAPEATRITPRPSSTT